MESNAFSAYQMDLADEEEQEDMDWDLTTAAMAAIVAGVLIARQRRVERRHERRLYLTRPQLLPDPRSDTPWQVLYASRNDRAFITTMGFDTQSFEDILEAGFYGTWTTTPIPRGDTAATGNPRPGARSLDAAGALGLALHFLNSTMREISLQQIFALIPSTVSRYIHFSLDILLAVLRQIPDARIQWPSGIEEFQSYNNLIVTRHPLLTGAFASIDGLNLPVQTANDPEIENATYNGWLCEHFVSSVLVFSPEGTIIAAKINAPGSWHDSRVARTIYEKLRTQTPDGFYLVADTAFPRGANQIEGRIRAPIKTGQTLRGTASEIQEKLAFDRQLLSYRQTAEWGMRGLQGAFGRLRLPLEIDNAERRANLLETCIRLHNFRARRVGHNQIREVYMPLWRQTTEDEQVWDGFEKMLFSDQRRKDRVARFHNFAVFNS
ncbi:hypothetical protein MSAN_00441500 [Mycena sanguinolenta]|uniref:DDE Tnp4 domain-containing protein n=1 Tax=Mycena sanguinolenta TaxID=230812 RepID=A0A8H6ZAV8_9AGAR|nr:hypothetical protein MSAN_00441500 [Mycena sanguinolenta]